MKTLNQERDRVQVTAIHSDIFAPEEVASFELCQDGQDSFCGVLPENDHLRELLGMPENATVEDILRLALFNPLKELAFTRGKRVRAQLVNLGYRLVGESTTPPVTAAQQCRSCAEVVELIHAGSLVIDDIEDGSHVRRGRPALHVRFGLPIALNAGNWLYFWPFQMLKELQLPGDKLLFLYEHYHQTLLKAHFGQALDLGARVDALPQDQVSRACIASMKLKTGALMGFAFALGGSTAGVGKSVLRVLDEFGTHLGVALQMFDDLGNLTGKREPSKRYEDLMLYRPSWAWACAADHSLPGEYENFVTAVSELPHTTQVDMWLEKHRLLELGRKRARRHMDFAFRQLETQLNAERVRWSKGAFEELRELGEGIAIAYG
jgi:geranylgeranyl pyrophosphate synthase